MEIDLLESDSMSYSEDGELSKDSSETGNKYFNEIRSVLTVKKIYSIDRIAFNKPGSKIEIPNKCSEKPSKESKLIRTNSSSSELQILSDVTDFSKQSINKIKFERSDGFLFDVLEMKKFALSNYIQENSLAADLKWSLFCAACHSYRYNSALRPFPPMFIQHSYKDIDKLRDVAESCPSVNVLFDQIQERAFNTSLELINLLYWVLIHLRDPQLKSVPQEYHSNILNKVASTKMIMRPHYIFKVVHNSKNLDYQKFMDLTRNYKTSYAYHCTRLDNFFSLLHYGLKISFNKIPSFGPGIHLSHEIKIGLPHSQSGYSWGGSLFGSQINMVALCEMIEHPDVRTADETIFTKNRNCETDKGENVNHEKHYIIEDCELVRVRYLLLYCNKNSESKYKQFSAITSWLQKHKVIAVITVYIFLLMAIITSNSSFAYNLYKKLLRKFGFKA